MKVKVPFKWLCCDHGWHGWHEVEIEVEVAKYGNLIDVNLRAIGYELQCDVVVELDTKKKTIKSW